MPPRRRSIVGQTFGKLVVAREVGFSASGNVQVECNCSCGTANIFNVKTLKDARATSCGCDREFWQKHGKSFSGEYSVWRSMRARCEKPNARAYPNYGGRGITVCERWKTFGNFYADMGDRPSALHTIERKDNEGNYEPGNCHWATRRDQQNNTRRNRHIEHNGETLTWAQFCRRHNLTEKYDLVRQCFAAGQTAAQVLERFQT